jgi:hypothetical protein
LGNNRPRCAIFQRDRRRVAAGHVFVFRWFASRARATPGTNLSTDSYMMHGSSSTNTAYAHGADEAKKPNNLDRQLLLSPAKLAAPSLLNLAP